jgi:hypothetical protein
MITLYYDDLIAGNGSSDIVRSKPSIPDHLKRLNIPYNIQVTGNNTIENDHLNLYTIELFRVDYDIEEAFKKISKDTIDFIVNNNIKLLVYYPYEGFDLTLYDNWFKRIHVLFEKYNFGKIKKYFIFNNLYIDSYYREFLTLYPNLSEVRFSKVFGYNFFHSDSYFNIVNNNLRLNNNLISKNKDFVCYNSQFRPHRLFLVSELIRRNLIKNSYVSMIGTQRNYPDTSLDYAKTTLFNILSTLDESPMIDHCINYVNNWTPMILDRNDKEVDFTHFELEHYQHSFFSVVTETGMGNPLRLTEKTFKPISNKHPFIIVGCSNTLSYLRSLGYETFPELFDESYDDIEDSGLRLLSVIEQIEHFCNLPKHEKNKRFNAIKYKLDHNYKVFMTDAVTKHRTEFNTILEQIKND